MSGSTSLLSSIGITSITGYPYVDALILATLVPFVISYITALSAFIQKILTTIVWNKLYGFYHECKKKYVGAVDYRTKISQEKNIYPTIRSIFFSSVVKSDDIDLQTIGKLNLITESKFESEYHIPHDDIYLLDMDQSNNITIEKSPSFKGSAVSKKYFEIDDYYIVVSENKKTDYVHYFGDEINKDKSTNTEYFILFEAIRKDSSSPKNDNIIRKFLFDRFQLEQRIPCKYVIHINDSNLSSKLTRASDIGFVNGDGSRAELKISEPFEKFLSHPKVRTFYNCEFKNSSISSNNQFISSSLMTNFKGNIITKESITNELFFTNVSNPNTDGENKLFTPNFLPIVKYFFGNRFKPSGDHTYYFYFEDNKIILYFANKDDNRVLRYLCIVSFQEILNRENITEILSDLVTQQKQEIVELSETKIAVYNYNSTNKEWKGIRCKSRSYDTIYLPFIMKKLITTEMEKFICFEKVFRENGIPYKKGFLFYGPPGTGKTSLVKALALTYRIPIYIFDINNGSINDENITSIINSISGDGNRILLFEDIDSAFSEKEELKYQAKSNEIIMGNTGDQKPTDPTLTSKKYLTYSGLLNALDGVMSEHNGTIMIMTTNYRDKLGQALIRPGRIDFCLELTYCDREQIIDMTKNMITNSYKIIQKEFQEITVNGGYNKIIFDNPYSQDELAQQIEKFADKLMKGNALSKVKPCELQTYILKHIENVENIFTFADELLF
jgi:hypothetical protein